MDIKTKKIIRAEIVSLLQEKSVLTLHGDQGVIKLLCRKYKLNESTEATTIANLFHSTKEYESELIDSKFPNEIRLSSKFINDMNKTKSEKVIQFISSNHGVTLIGLAVVVIGIFMDYRSNGYSAVFWEDKGLLLAGVLIAVIGLLKK